MHEQVKNLLRNGRTEAALKLLAENNTDAIVLLNKYMTVQRQSSLGTLNFSESMQANAQIVNAALQLIKNTPIFPQNTAVIETTRTNTNSASNKETIKVFLSYSHKDEDIKEQLDTHLVSLRRSNTITSWNDRKIQAGEEWDASIKSELQDADIILLLISANFIASEYIWKNEVTKAMERHQKREAVVIPIFIKPCDWEGMPFEKIQGLPKDAKPVNQHSNIDAALMEIAKGVRAVAKRLKG